MGSFRAACIQMRSGIEPEANLSDIGRLARQAAAGGAQLIATPEMAVLLDRRSQRCRSKAQAWVTSTTRGALAKLAAELGVWLLVGSEPILSGGDKCYNRSYLIAPDGQIAAHYDKIHLFDVELGKGEFYRESSAYEAGTESLLANTPLGAIGMTVCYDLRFPYLYRALAKAGAQLIMVPAAFTRPTGEAHWHVLLRARAIETGCYVLAPAQAGVHEDGRETYGHSLVVAPWGEVIAEAEDAEPGVIFADIDLGTVDEARKKVPSLTHDRAFTVRTANLG